MKRMLRSLIGILSAVLLIGAGTLVYFTYAEASTGDISPGGNLDLEIMGEGLKPQMFQLLSVAPGDSGRGSNRLVNAGAMAGELSISFSEVINTPGTSGEHADGSGDLGASIEIAVYIDVDASGDWNSGDIGLKSNGSTYSFPTALDRDHLDNYGGMSWNAVELIDSLAVHDFVILWRVPITVGNEIQGDSVSIDITFTLEQVAADYTARTQ